MKKLLTILFLLPLFAVAQRPLKAGWNENKVKILSSNFYYPAMIYLPSDYFDAGSLTKRYPLILAFEGSGEVGSDTTKILANGMCKNISNNGVASYVDDSRPSGGPTVTYTLGTDEPTANDKNGNSRTAIIVSVQANSYGVNPSWFPYMFADITGRLGLRVDSSMVYPYGYSAGNWAASGIICSNTDTTYNRFITAIVVNSGATQDLKPYSIFKKIADRKIPTLLVVGGSDISYRDQMRTERDTINFYSTPDVALYEEVAGQGHGGFDANALASKTWTATGGKNFYQWMFQYANPYATTWAPSGSASPVAHAGTDQSWNMPKTSTTLNGGGSTGTITSVTWRKISGGHHPQEGVVVNPNSLVTTIQNFGVGDWSYELSISDGTTTSKDTVIIHGLPFKSKTPNPTHRKINLTPSGGEYYFTNIIASLGALNGSDTLNLTQSAGTCQFYGDDGNGGWGGDSVNQLVITADPGVVITGAMRTDGEYIKIHGINFAGGTHTGIVLTKKHYAVEVEGCTFQDGENFIYAKSRLDTTDVLTYGVLNGTMNWDHSYNYFHNNTVFNSTGEAMYLNTTFSDEDTLAPSTFADYYPIKMSNLIVTNNTVKNTGWDGIQVSNAPNATITHNTVDSTGLICKSAQLNGIILGGYSYGRVDSNDVRNTKGAAIFIAGSDSVKVRGNVIVNGGYSDIQTDLDCASGLPYTAIDVTDNIMPSIGEPLTDLAVVISDNCIQNVTSYTGGAAIRIRNSNGTMRPGIISNNKIGDPASKPLGQLIFDASGSTLSGNTLGTCSPVNLLPSASAGGDQTITLPTDFITLDGSGSSDPDGSIASYSWAQISGPTQATIVLSAQVSTTVNGLVPGVYIFRITVTDNNGATSTDDIQITVKAVVVRNLINEAILKKVNQNSQ